MSFYSHQHFVFLLQHRAVMTLQATAFHTFINNFTEQTDTLPHCHCASNSVTWLFGGCISVCCLKLHMWSVKCHHNHHHHHHVHEGLVMFPVPWSSKWNWSLHLFLGRPMFLRPFGLHCNACLVFCLCPFSVRVVATFPGNILFPLLCSVFPFFP